VAKLGDPHHAEVLRRGGEWLVAAPGLEGAPLPGLYVGEAGIGTALLRAGQVLGDEELIAAAAERGRRVAALPYSSPDLLNGTAGRLRFHLFLWDATGAPEHLRDAITCGERLLAAATRNDDGVCWTIPSGYLDLSGKSCLGYAHGAAGIADALLDLFEATGDDRFLASARDAGRWLLPQALPALDDGSGLDWPDLHGAALNGTFWCRGAAGVGRFFLHAADLDILPEAAETAARAARAVARGSRWTSATQCHGLAGSIEFLLDVYQATADRAYLIEARSLARILEAFATERDGLLVWPSESPHVYSPDYMVGYAGVGVCLLRLADPDRHPHQLSRRGFQYRPTPGQRGLCRASADRLLAGLTGRTTPSGEQVM
jgi:lantibiotic modifying enzyme